MTFNVFAFGMSEDAVMQVIRDGDADVVALQEPPLWTWGHRRMRRLAARLGYDLVVCRGAARTTGIMVRQGLEQVTGFGGVALGPRVSRLRLGWPTPRGYSWIGIGQIKIFNVHLSLFAKERARHVARIHAALKEHGITHAVLTGDLNEEPDGPAWQVFAELIDAGAQHNDFTYSPQRPVRRIDVILAGSGIEAGAARTVRSPAAAAASDHFAVVCDLHWPEPVA